MPGDRIQAAVADGERILWRGRASWLRIIGWKWRHLAIGLLLVAVAGDLIPLLGSSGPDYHPDIEPSDAEFVSAVASLFDLVASAVVGIVGLWILIGAVDVYLDEAGREYAVTDRRIISSSRSDVSSTPLHSVVSARSTRTSFGGGVEVALAGRGGVLRLAGIADAESAVRAMCGGTRPPAKDS